MASQMSDVSEKLRYAFKMYDEDGSGTIDKGEMVDIVTNLYSMQGVAKVLNSAETELSCRITTHHHNILSYIELACHIL